MVGKVDGIWPKLAAVLLIAATLVASEEVLVVHWLHAQEEDAFSHVDRALSSFWHNWDGRDAAQITQGTHTFIGYDNWDTANDAAAIVKAAGGVTGRYLYVAVEDDRWLDSSQGGWGSDLLRVYLDSADARDIPGCADCLMGLFSTLLTYTTELLDIRMGWSDTVTAGLEYWTSEPDNLGGFAHLPLTPDQLREYSGMEIELVEVSPNVRALELKVPWAVFAVRGMVLSTDELATGLVPASGARTGFCLTYMDVDTVDQDTCALSWTGKDPWRGDANYWGNLVFDDGFPPQPTPVESLLSVTESPGCGLRSTPRLHTGTIYSLTGRLLNEDATSSGRSPRVIVERTAAGYGYIRFGL